MIKLTIISKTKFIIVSILVFFCALLIKINLVVPLVLISTLSYLRLRNLKYDPLKLILLFLIIFTASFFIIYQQIPIFCIPFSLIPMLATILFNQLEISFLLSVASALSVASLAGGNFSLVIFFLIGGIFSSILVKDIHRRVEIIRAGFMIGIIQVILLLALDSLRIFDPLRYLILFLNGFLYSLLVTGALPLFEMFFNTTTNISLLELADFNRPLLQRMTLEAPGTYHHSLIVGNLSEAASRMVGANPLLARIGAYYHDIGKVEKAEYFSENQTQANKHDDLSPTMSKMVIMNHVKEGAELAKKYKLNQRIVDFILQHHGKSLVYYFYRRALEALEEDQEIKEEGFRYPGPKPNSKESAIVLLADSVEAATRALLDPAPAKIEELVHKIINNKFIDGQLDECDLTLKDLEIISAVFIRILNGIYHARIAYPEKDIKSENNHKKSAKENPHLSDKDKKSSS